EAEAAGADARATELGRRLEHAGHEREELEAELGRLEEQGHLFAEHIGELADRMSQEEQRLERARAHVDELLEQDVEARRLVVDAEDLASRVRARLAALETLDREFHGFAPAVAAALARREEFAGLVGPLAEVLELPADRAASIEATLNSLLQLLVVRDEAAADRVRQWLETGGAGADATGAIAFLRLESVPKVQDLLGTLEFAGGRPEDPVVVGRRARIAALHADVESSAAQLEEQRRRRAAVAARVETANAELRAAEDALREAEMELRRAETDEASRARRHAQVQRSRGELEERKGAILEGADRVRQESANARTEGEGLVAALAAKGEERRAAAALVTEREATWDEVREEEAEARILHGRGENALASIDRRLAATDEAVRHAARRLEAFDQEEAGHQETLTRAATERESGGEALARAFEERDRITVEVGELDERAERDRAEITTLEQRVRELRGSVDRLGEERHQLELRQTQVDASLRSVRERLEAEWGRPLEQLMATAEPADGGPETLRAELREITADLERLGPVNLLAIEEFEEEKQRLEFLTSQRDDLVGARAELDAAIRQINRTARRLFEETFDAIRANFHRTFDSLFPGGEADIWLEDETDPLESAIEISASPRGKRTQRIGQLSGGERALTALALLFAIYLVKPSPFCVLDEVDAPLDDANVERFLAMLQRFKEDTQFIVITHNPRTMEAADWIYGVTMEEAGVSSIVGVRLDDVMKESA
ncbi:MAG: AAA family ATPase, partial [Longimicrobiales bacterium]